MVTSLQKISVRPFSLKNYPVETGLKASVHALHALKHLFMTDSHGPI